MANKATGLDAPDSLRSEARRRLGRSATDTSEWSRADTQSLVAELEVHQEELRIQNEELESALDRYRNLFEQAPVGYLLLDQKGRIREANRLATELLSDDTGVIGRPLAAYVDADSQDTLYFLRRALAPDMAPRTDELTLASVGESRHIVQVETLADPTTDPDDPRFRCALVDITRRRALEADHRLLAIAFHTNQALMITDPAETIERVNTAFTTITGYTAKEAVDANPKILASGQHDTAFYAALWGQLKEQGHWEGEIWNRRKNGEIYPEWQSINAVRDEQGRIAHYLAVFHDITEQKRLEAELKRLATHDRLTGIYNRAKLYELLEIAREENERYGTPFSVVMFDVDHFKAVNDRLGHQAGDEALRKLTHRIDGGLRETDAFGRWGGEEFLVLASHADVQDAAELAERLRARVARTPFEEIGTITISLGVAAYEPGETAEGLERRVDNALYAAKEVGRNRIAIAEASAQER